MNAIEELASSNSALISREEMRALFFLTLQGKVGVQQVEEMKEQLKSKTGPVINFDKNEISFVNEFA